VTAPTLWRSPAADEAAHLLIGSACAAIGALTLEVPRLVRWAELIAERLGRGATLLTAGNGGSATHAAHLSSELVGRFRHDRRALPAICLSSDGPTLTALGNDYGFEQVFARQVEASARAGDVVVVFSTSGRSPNVVAAARAAAACGATTLALTGPRPNPLATVADDALVSTGVDTAAIQDSHHVAVHALCASLDQLLGVVP
jgi:D-sedoheptulose 7-phosphate isomerase